jgi:hypothetical protein
MCSDAGQRDGEGLENTCQSTDRRLMHATQPAWREVPKHEPQRAGARPAAPESVGIVEQGVASVRVIVTEEVARQKKSLDESLVYEVQIETFAQEDYAKAVLDHVQE